MAKPVRAPGKEEGNWKSTDCRMRKWVGRRSVNVILVLVLMEVEVFGADGAGDSGEEADGVLVGRAKGVRKTS